MNQLAADHELLESLKRDVVTTMSHLQARITAQLGDLGTYGFKKSAAELLSEIITEHSQDIQDALGRVRDALPTQREWDRLEADRQRQDKYKDARA